MSAELAINGGSPVRESPFPEALHGVLEVGEEEIEAVTGVLRDGRMFRFLKDERDSYAGRFERRMADYIGTEYSLAVTGGTTALISALIGLGVSTGDEVIIPAYTYIATPAALLNVGAIPVIAEVDETLTIDPRDIEERITPLTRGIIPVHMRGLPAQMDEIMEIARDNNLFVLEDVAQANGGMYRGQKLGSIGDAGTFSFQHYKVITSSEGGMVVTDDREIYKRAAYYHDSALQFWEGKGDLKTFAGQNYRMCELRAAVGYTQMDRIEGILERTRMIKRRIVEGLRDVPGVQLQRVADPGGDCGLAVVFFVESSDAAERFSSALEAEGIPCSTVYNKGVPDRHIYKYWDYVLNKWSWDRTGYPWSKRYYSGDVSYSPDMCPRSLDYLGRAVMIGIGHRFTTREVDDTVEAVKKVANGNGRLI